MEEVKNDDSAIEEYPTKNNQVNILDVKVQIKDCPPKKFSEKEEKTIDIECEVKIYEFFFKIISQTRLLLIVMREYSIHVTTVITKQSEIFISEIMFSLFIRDYSIHVTIVITK